MTATPPVEDRGPVRLEKEPDPDSTKPAHRLERSLGVGFGVAVGVGMMIGAGILRSPAAVARQLPNPWLFLGAWLLGGVWALLGEYESWLSTATKTAAATDVPAWCRMRGQEYVGADTAPDGVARYLVRRTAT